MDLIIKRPRQEDIEPVMAFFALTLKDTFEKNGIAGLEDVYERIIAETRQELIKDIASGGKEKYFLIAMLFDEIVGLIAYGPSNMDINKCTDSELKDIIEIGPVFVRPDCQNKGVMTAMLEHIVNELYNKGIDEFCLDSGYRIAQGVWAKKFGQPQYVMKDYWGEGYDHMIWRVNIKDVLKTKDKDIKGV